jgi:adenosylmethionine-8-amino-7-oxononanoate aminotransferase
VHGNRYIDASGGPAVYSLGHGNIEVNEALKRQLDQIAHAYRYTFTSDALEELESLVTEACGPNYQDMVFVTGGSEAVEGALKIALQYHTAKGDASRRRFISRKRSWHGNTLGALGVSEFLDRRAAFEGALVEASHVSAANVYRPPPGVAPNEIANFCAAELKQEIERLGPSRVAAFIFEPVVGAAGGVVPAPPGYAKAMREVCTRYGVLMIADEVMCGSGRCGTWRALEHDGVEPDIMPIAKGLGGGYVPLGATVYHKSVADVLFDVDGGPMTGHTFTGHTLACAAGVAVQKIVKRDGLLARIRRGGPRLMQRLGEELKGVPQVGDVRGRGYFIGVEFVENPRTKAPFPAALGICAGVVRAAAADGLLCYPSPTNVDGINGDTAILAPPYNATDDQLEEIAVRFGRAVKKILPR